MYVYSHYGISVYLQLPDNKKVLIKGKNQAKDFLIVGRGVPILSDVDLTSEEVEYLKNKYKNTDLFKKGLIYFSEDINNAKAEMKNLSQVEVPLSPHTEEKISKKRSNKIKPSGNVVEGTILEGKDLI